MLGAFPDPLPLTGIIWQDPVLEVINEGLPPVFVIDAGIKNATAEFWWLCEVSPAGNSD